MLCDDIEDRIALAGHPAEVTGILQHAWGKHADGLITVNELETIEEAARARREALGEPGPKPRQAPVAAQAASVRRPVRPPKPPRQRSPDRQASLARQWRLLNELPRAARLLFEHQPGKGAVVAVIRQELQKHGACTISVPEIAGRAGVSDRTVQHATTGPHGISLFIVKPRRLGPLHNDTNVITLTSYGCAILLSGKMVGTAERARGSGEMGFGARRSVSKKEGFVDNPKRRWTPPKEIRPALVGPKPSQGSKQGAFDAVGATRLRI